MGICLTSSAERMGRLNRLPYAQRLSGPIRGKIRISYPATFCQTLPSPKGGGFLMGFPRRGQAGISLCRPGLFLI